MHGVTLTTSDSYVKKARITNNKIAKVYIILLRWYTIHMNEDPRRKIAPDGMPDDPGVLHEELTPDEVEDAQEEYLMIYPEMEPPMYPFEVDEEEED
jgi:hypothetical protein